MKWTNLLPVGLGSTRGKPMIVLVCCLDHVHQYHGPHSLALGRVICGKCTTEALPKTALSGRPFCPRLCPLPEAYIQLLDDVGEKGLVPWSQFRRTESFLWVWLRPTFAEFNFLHCSILLPLPTYECWWMHIPMNFVHAIFISECASQGTWSI